MKRLKRIGSIKFGKIFMLAVLLLGIWLASDLCAASLRAGIQEGQGIQSIKTVMAAIEAEQAEGRKIKSAA